MKTNKYIQKIIQLNIENEDRHDFHNKVAPVLIEMGKDPEFWNEVVRRNFTDKGFLQRKWTMYEIPFYMFTKQMIFY